MNGLWECTHTHTFISKLINHAPAEKARGVKYRIACTDSPALYTRITKEEDRRRKGEKVSQFSDRLANLCWGKSWGMKDDIKETLKKKMQMDNNTIHDAAYSMSLRSLARKERNNALIALRA